MGNWNRSGLYDAVDAHPARERARACWSVAGLGGCDALCEQILADPWCEEEREAARRILPRVRRKLDGGRCRGAGQLSQTRT